MIIKVTRYISARQVLFVVGESVDEVKDNFDSTGYRDDEWETETDNTNDEYEFEVV